MMINNINNINNINKIEFSKININGKANINSEIIVDKNEEKIEINKGQTLSVPLKKSNPPKKKGENKEDNNGTKTNNESDLIMSELSFTKINNKGQNSEISFENISREKPIYIDNLVLQGNMLENNYLDFPVEYENQLIFNIFRKAVYLNDDEDQVQHYNTSDSDDDYDIITENKKKKINKKITKKNNWKVKKLLEKENLYGDDEDNSIKKNYESDNNEENKYNKNKDKYKKNKNNIESGPDSLLDNRLFIENKISRKYEKNNENNLIEESKNEIEININENSKVNDIINLKERKKLKKRIISPINKKEIKQEESKYDKGEDEKNARLKTDYDDGTKYKIKNTLKHLGKKGIIIDESSSSSFTKNMNINSALSEKNKLMISQNSKILDNKDNKDNDNNKKYIPKNVLNLQGENTNVKNKKKGKKRIIKNSKMKKGIKIKDKEEKEEDIISEENNKKSDFDVFNEKALGSSISSFLETKGDKLIIQENLFLFYWKYLKKRELFLVCILDHNDSIPYFIRWSCLVFCIIFIFMLNCLSFFESNVHNRYSNALEGKSNDIKYYFKKEFLNTLFVSLISIVFKMVIIKLVLNRLLKIKKRTKKMMLHSYEKKIEETELEQLEQKRYDYLVCYHIKIISYFTGIMLISLFISYMCINYGGIFKNSINAFFFGLLFSIILSFILCAIICFIIVSIYKISRILRNRCLLSTYIVLSTIY